MVETAQGHLFVPGGQPTQRGKAGTRLMDECAGNEQRQRFASFNNVGDDWVGWRMVTRLMNECAGNAALCFNTVRNYDQGGGGKIWLLGRF